MTVPADDDIDITIRCHDCRGGRYKKCWHCGNTGRQFLVAGYLFPLTLQGEIFAKAVARKWGNAEIVEK